jgi:hypothetical protein
MYASSTRVTVVSSPGHHPGRAGARGLSRPREAGTIMMSVTPYIFLLRSPSRPHAWMRCQQLWMWQQVWMWHRQGGGGAGWVGVAPAGRTDVPAGVAAVSVTPAYPEFCGRWSVVRPLLCTAGHRADPGLPRRRAIEPIRDCPGGGLPVLRSQRQRPLRHATRPAGRGSGDGRASGGAAQRGRDQIALRSDRRDYQADPVQRHSDTHGYGAGPAQPPPRHPQPHPINERANVA